MAIFIWRWVTVVLTVYTIVSTLPSSCANPLSAGKTSTSKVIQSKADCLFNQYYDIINQVCENCTLCPPGTQHSSQEICGNGEGVNTTCDPCEEKKKYQPREGYSQLKCTSCVTCDLNADILQNCSATQNADCGPCHAGYYAYQENVCVECTQNPGHEDCKQTMIPTTKPTTRPRTPTNLTSASTDKLPSTPATTLPTPLKTDDHPSSSIPSDERTTETQQIGSQTTKGGALSFGLGIGAVIVVILICVALYWFIQRRRRRSGSSNTPKPALGNATYNAVPTISTDQPSTSLAVDAGIECEPVRRISRQSSREPDREPDRQQLIGAGSPVPSPSFSPSEVTNDCPSMPKTLSIHGGEIRDGLGIMCPHVDPGQFGYGAQMSTEGEPSSPGSAKVNLNFQNDDGQNNSTA